MTDVALAFEETGRIPAVAQDADSGEVLMLAYVTEEALDRTRETGLAHYYSRSREELWQKGESSGHVQEVAEVRVDCDGDAVLYLVDQEGGACHTGHRSCFYRTVDGETVGEQVFDPDAVYETDGGTAAVPNGDGTTDVPNEDGTTETPPDASDPDEPDE